MMLATIPNHPMIAGTGTASEVANRIEYESVPIENRICANAKTEFFVHILPFNGILRFSFMSCVYACTRIICDSGSKRPFT
jgi:hypothetical protein